MNLKLTRKEYSSTGIFGELTPEGGWFLLFTLEHAYQVQPDGVLGVSRWTPKIPPGSYSCIRGLHQLDHSQLPFETFEITDVPGHTGLLFHKGNLEKDSSGCVLLGLIRQDDELVRSSEAFSQFMSAEAGCDSFSLWVE